MLCFRLERPNITQTGKVRSSYVCLRHHDAAPHNEKFRGFSTSFLPSPSFDGAYVCIQSFTCQPGFSNRAFWIADRWSCVFQNTPIQLGATVGGSGLHNTTSSSVVCAIRSISCFQPDINPIPVSTVLSRSSQMTGRVSASINRDILPSPYWYGFRRRHSAQLSRGWQDFEL